MARVKRMPATTRARRSRSSRRSCLCTSAAYAWAAAYEYVPEAGELRAARAARTPVGVEGVGIPEGSEVSGLVVNVTAREEGGSANGSDEAGAGEGREAAGMRARALGGGAGAERAPRRTGGRRGRVPMGACGLLCAGGDARKGRPGGGGRRLWLDMREEEEEEGRVKEASWP